MTREFIQNSVYDIQQRRKAKKQRHNRYCQQIVEILPPPRSGCSSVVALWDMWTAAAFIIFGYMWLSSFFWSSLHLFVFFSLVYGIYFFASSSHREGTRAWSRFREWTLWDVVRRRHFHHSWHQGNGWRSFERHGEAYLFIVHPQNYGVTSFFAFGLHGQQCRALQRLRPLVMMSRFFFWVPLLTDFIQWAGGIVHTTEEMQDALNHNRSVVWAPLGGGMMTSHDIAHGVALQEEALDIRVFEWISAYGSKCRFNIVPVHHTGEEDAYYNTAATTVSGSGWLQSLRRYMHTHTGYEFPLCVFGWGGTFIPRRVELRTKVGEPISTMDPILDERGEPTGQYMRKTAHHLRDEFREQFNRLSVPDSGERPFQIVVSPSPATV